MMITGEKVNLRPVLAKDLPKIVEWTLDSQVGHLMDDDGYPENVEECNRWFKETRSNRHKKIFMIALKDGTPIGDIELDHITWRSGDAELKIRIGEKGYWNQGYGTDAVITLLQHAFSSMHLSRVYLRVDRENRPAIRVYEKAGFKKEGRLLRSSEEGEREILLMRILAREFSKRWSKHLQDVV